jgi:hypothetical protein
MKSKNVSSAILVLTVSFILGILICEGASRVILNPADYLSAKMIKDDVLGIRIAPNRSGFDEWGFRNTGVPEKADIVTIGDSMTYGNTATMMDSWPSVLARTTNLQVYNLGIGGYGPNQYYHLLTTKALALRPRWVICGVSMNDDFENAFSITYGLEYWSFLRNGESDGIEVHTWETDEPTVLAAGLRNWLSENSVMYKLIFHGPLLAMVKEAVQFGLVSKESDPSTTTLVLNDKGIREAFRPTGIAQRLEQSSASVREGMRISFRLLGEMDQACEKSGCKLVVVILPTKESVFSDYIEGKSDLHLHDILDQVVRNERLAKKALIRFLEEAGVEYLDALPALKREAINHIYTQSTRDMDSMTHQ